MTTHNQALGQFGEDAAASWYSEHGYTVVDRNWRGLAGELDLVVSHRPSGQTAAEIVFAEVKTRTNPRFGEGVLAVNWKKQQRIRRLSGQWLSEQRQRFEGVRFDIVDVDARGNVVVYEEAF